MTRQTTDRARQTTDRAPGWQGRALAAAGHRQEVIEQLAAVLSGLEVPMSLGLPLGTAREPWAALHAKVGFGYHKAEEYEKWLTEVFE